jgi:hypothetical protein
MIGIKLGNYSAGERMDRLPASSVKVHNIQDGS